MTVPTLPGVIGQDPRSLLDELWENASPQTQPATSRDCDTGSVQLSYDQQERAPVNA